VSFEISISGQGVLSESFRSAKACANATLGNRCRRLGLKTMEVWRDYGWPWRVRGCGRAGKWSVWEFCVVWLKRSGDGTVWRDPVEEITEMREESKKWSGCVWACAAGPSGSKRSSGDAGDEAYDGYQVPGQER